MDAPTHVGRLIEVRIIGVLEARQTEEVKTMSIDRLLGVAIHSYRHQHVSSITQLSKSLLTQVEEFFISYNKQRGKRFKVTGSGRPARAVQFLKRGIRAYKKRQHG